MIYNKDFLDEHFVCCDKCTTEYINHFIYNDDCSHDYCINNLAGNSSYIPCGSCNPPCSKGDICSGHTFLSNDIEWQDILTTWLYREKDAKKIKL